MAQVAFIASGEATLVGGTVQVPAHGQPDNPLITANSIVLTNVNAVGLVGAGRHLAAVPHNGRVVFTSLDEGGNVAGNDVYSFNYVILVGGDIDSDITANIDAHKVFLEQPGNQAQNTLYMANLNAQKAADTAIEAVNPGAVAAVAAAAVAANAAAAAAVNDPIAPGEQRQPFPYPLLPAPLKLKASAYTNEFFNCDAIGKNHNGTTIVDVPFGAGAGAARTMTGFYNQITTGDPLAAAFNAHVVGSFRDALKYYIDESDDDELKPYLRYKMPVYHFRAVAAQPVNVVAHYIPILPTSRLPYFSEAGLLVTDINGVNGPIPNSFEAKSLQYDFNKGRIERTPNDDTSKLIRKITSTFQRKFEGYKYGSEAMIPAVAGMGFPVPIRILPNFLHGCCIRTSEPTSELYRPLTHPTETGYADVWCKLYPANTQPVDPRDGIKKTGCVIPYNKDQIHIPDNYYMVERWDGVVLFVYKITSTYVDMPVGCVMVGDIAPLNNDNPQAVEWNTHFLPAITATRNLFLTAGTGAAVRGEMFPGGRSYIPNVMSHAMGLAMYVYNVRVLGSKIPDRTRNVVISGGYTKKNITKKNRNMNKRQRQRRSKSKSMSMLKSAKRTFYRTNKRNKTSRQYH
jgi:hypothetical protein